MSEMQFETDNQNEFGRPPSNSGGFNLTGKLVSWGLVSTEQEAQYVLVGISVLALVVAAYFVFSGGGGSAPPLLPQ
ncbi:hypothetical protein A3H16_01430 [Candidatus Kaiserbacteria bacterium RIFCSPLOWO2_12_FULL_53_8]|uniref:Uncharacterized protein n=2 Tax=Candidatus Kaiseribacteriota TaxID=1752734 RepID=A0A1F6CXA5_9BACT|nr:MAG: hypothetical protein A2851_02170 [Candidatus Kaiserbacteria bacterium RIFCSPHIGHO2_01_FULL_53_29]OGG91372.1 MAG: hypothetical protein A3H16_01430 [Candidatus Kaiserbacteria bacterium RIFCSPLOWO2_12_FULL_53_8]